MYTGPSPFLTFACRLHISSKNREVVTLYRHKSMFMKHVAAFYYHAEQPQKWVHECTQGVWKYILFATHNYRPQTNFVLGFRIVGGCVLGRVKSNIKAFELPLSTLRIIHGRPLNLSPWDILTRGNTVVHRNTIHSLMHTLTGEAEGWSRCIYVQSADSSSTANSNPTETTP